MGDLLRINLGSGRKIIHGYLNVDKTQILSEKGKKLVDYIVDLEKERLPFEDNSIDEILADNVFEHITNLEHVMNECHRVVKQGGLLHGVVPIAGSIEDYKDPTHVRHFVKETFTYFYGKANWNKEEPIKPKYAKYGYKAWRSCELKEKNNLIIFKLIK